MKLPLIFIFLQLCLTNDPSAQGISSPGKTEKKDTLVKADSVAAAGWFNCRVVRTAAVFENGANDWETYLGKNLKLDVPSRNGCPPGKYTVRINFVVDRNGKITNAKATTNFGYGMEEEVKSVISRSPKWIPATQNGRIVNAYRFQLITFEVCEPAMVNLITGNYKPNFEKLYK